MKSRTSVGTPVEPRNVNRYWEELCCRAGVRRLRVHDLRHSTASFLLVAGIDIKVVQTMLRHARLATTADTYTHVLAEVQRAAADQFDALLRGAVAGGGAGLVPVHSVPVGAAGAGSAKLPRGQLAGETARRPAAAVPGHDAPPQGDSPDLRTR